MSRKLLTIGGLIILVVAAFAIGWFLATRFGFGPAFGMMGYGGFGMHPNLRAMPFGHMRGVGLFGWGGMLFAGGFALLGWLLQIGLIAALVAWLLKRSALAQTSNPPHSQNQQ
ncbi:MAG TPA: hypothetical protein VI793_04915 [Anaerolineales bacterium]|nr:hypothetical protein [Anaerolineales bacterium]